MTMWNDIADAIVPTQNHGPAMPDHRGVVLHIAQGTYAGTVSWCQRTDIPDRIGPHFVVGPNGEITQMIDTAMQSWCQADGNLEWISIENAGWSGAALTAQQVSACARILAKANLVYGIPLQAAGSPTDRGLGHHSMGGSAWGNHPDCPGSPIIGQKQEIIRQATEIVGGGTVALTSDDLRDITENVTKAVIDGSWRDGYCDTTFTAGYRGVGGHTLAAAHAKIDALTSANSALSSQLATLTSKVDALTAAIGTPTAIDYELLAPRLAAELMKQIDAVRT
jgi:hypothetical protein